MNKVHMMAAGALALGLLAGCNQGNTLSVTGGEPVSYQCEQGKKVQVQTFEQAGHSSIFRAAGFWAAIERFVNAA